VFVCLSFLVIRVCCCCVMNCAFSCVLCFCACVVVVLCDGCAFSYFLVLWKPCLSYGVGGVFLFVVLFLFCVFCLCCVCARDRRGGSD